MSSIARHSNKFRPYMIYTCNSFVQSDVLAVDLCLLRFLDILIYVWLILVEYFMMYLYIWCYSALSRMN